ANEHLKRTNTFATSNPQTQATSFAPDTTGAEISLTGMTDGQKFKIGSTATPTYTCTDAGGVDSCVGTAVSGQTMPKNSLGNKTFKVTAIDSSGNITPKEIAYSVNSVDYTGSIASGSVDTTLALTLPAAGANFGAFTPGIAKEYLATATPQITSTAGDA